MAVEEKSRPAGAERTGPAENWGEPSGGTDASAGAARRGLHGAISKAVGCERITTLGDCRTTTSNYLAEFRSGLRPARHRSGSGGLG